MKNRKFELIINNFDEADINLFLGDLYDEMIAWSFGENEHITKLKKIQILIEVKGFTLFQNEKFRELFFLSLDESLFNKLSNIAIGKVIDQNNTQVVLTKKNEEDRISQQFDVFLFNQRLF